MDLMEKLDKMRQLIDEIYTLSYSIENLNDDYFFTEEDVRKNKSKLKENVNQLCLMTESLQLAIPGKKCPRCGGSGRI